MRHIEFLRFRVIGEGCSENQKSHEQRKVESRRKQSIFPFFCSRACETSGLAVALENGRIDGLLRRCLDIKINNLSENIEKYSISVPLILIATCRISHGRAARLFRSPQEVIIAEESAGNATPIIYISVRMSKYLLNVVSGQQKYYKNGTSPR